MSLVGVDPGAMALTAAVGIGTVDLDGTLEDLYKEMHGLEVLLIVLVGTTKRECCGLRG